MHNLYDSIDPQKKGVRAPRELRAAASSRPAVNENEYQVAVRVLTAHFTPATNRKFEIHKFRQLKQQPGESVAAFCHRLRLNAAHCAFHDKDLELQLQILAGLRDDNLKQKLLEEGDISLDQTLAKAEAYETAASTTHQEGQTQRQAAAQEIVWLLWRSLPSGFGRLQG